MEAAFEKAEKTVEAAYHYAFLAHANMEPQNCTAQLHESGALELWAPTQNAAAGRGLISELLGISEQRIHVNQLRMGTAFGRRSRRDFMSDRVEILAGDRVTSDHPCDRDEEQLFFHVLEPCVSWLGYRQTDCSPLAWHPPCPLALHYRR